MYKSSPLLPKQIALFILLLILGLSLRLWHGHNKHTYHIDEGFSYLVSSLHLTDFKAITHNPNPVQVTGLQLQNLYNLYPKEYGQHAKIQSMIADDVHPPLYYHLLHETMRWSGGQQNKWQAIGLNLFLYVISACLLYLISRRLIPESPNGALFNVALWSLATGSITFSLFARMYELMTCFGLAATYFWLRWQQEERYRDGIAWMLTLWLGYLSHYYLLLWGGLLLLAGLYLSHKKAKKMLFFVGIWVGAGLLLLMSYPTALNHILHSSRSREIQNLTLKVSDLFNNIIKLLQIDTQYLLYQEVLLCALFLIIWGLIYHHTKVIPWLRGHIYFSALSIIGLIFGLVTAAISPYSDIRYHSLFLPWLVLWLSVLIFKTPNNYVKASSIGIVLSSFIFHALTYQQEWYNPLQNLQKNNILVLKSPGDDYMLWGSLVHLDPNQSYWVLNQIHLQQISGTPLEAVFTPEWVKQRHNPPGDERLSLWQIN